MREHAEDRFTPPAMGRHGALHRRAGRIGATSPSPWASQSDRPVEPWRASLDFLVSRKARRGFVKRAGCPSVTTAVASDLEWSHGDGPEVSGPAAALGLALCGPLRPGWSR